MSLIVKRYFFFRINKLKPLEDKAMPWTPLPPIKQDSKIGIAQLTAVINATYSEVSPVNITCEGTGNPNPAVRWIHNKRVKCFRVKTVHLTFSKITKADSGIYTCWANNSTYLSSK